MCKRVGEFYIYTYTHTHMFILLKQNSRKLSQKKKDSPMTDESRREEAEMKAWFLYRHLLLWI